MMRAVFIVAASCVTGVCAHSTKFGPGKSSSAQIYRAAPAKIVFPVKFAPLARPSTPPLANLNGAGNTVGQRVLKGCSYTCIYCDGRAVAQERERTICQCIPETLNTTLEAKRLLPPRFTL